MNDFLVAVKRAASEQYKSEKPVSVIGGTVVSSEPLKIKIDQKRTLTESFLVLTKAVVDYSVNMTVNHSTETHTHNHSYTDDGSQSVTGSNTHSHEYKGTKKFTVRNKLKVGDEVILLMVQGGKKYIVIDVIGGGLL